MIDLSNDLKVSVIVPIFNAEKYLDSCIQSVLRQTYRNWELILVDDGSKDRSGAIADEYQQADKRIRVLHTPNAGVSSARNQGIELATGNYIAFLDADDELTDDCLEKLTKTAVSDNADIVAGRYCSGRNSAEQKEHKFIWREQEAVKNSLMDNPFTYSAWAKLYRTDFIGETRFDSRLKVSEDSYFVFQLLCKMPIFIALEDKIYLYRNNPESATNEAFSSKFFDVLRVADLKSEIVEQQFPEMMDLAINMQLKARMSLLRVLAVRTKNEYHDLENEMLAWIKRNRQFYIPATKDDERWMFILRHQMYYVYKAAKHIQCAIRAIKH